MAEAVGDGQFGNSGDRRGYGQVKGLQRMRLAHAQMLFDDGPTGLDRIAIGRVGRQIEHFGAGRADCLGDAFDFVSRQVIRHHHLPTLATDGSQHGHRSPMATRGRLADALAASGPAITAGHIRSDTAFVQEDEAVGGDPGGLLSPRFALLLAGLGVLLSGVQTFFSCAEP